MRAHSRLNERDPGLIQRPPRIACIGECMIELRQQPDGSLTRGFGGDTLNTAVYLARLGAAVDYATALGDDPWSDEMIAAWSVEGVGTGLVRRLPGSLPGLYIIQTDAGGERRFHYWRDSAAARRMFSGPGGAELLERLEGYDLLYLSGITLSILDGAGRAGLFGAVDRVRARGGRLVFDTNFRPRGWPDLDGARALYRQALARSDIVLASTEDLAPLFGSTGEAELLHHAAGAERVLKLAQPAVQVMQAGTVVLVEADPVDPVADTTAAGDSFAAAYLMARLLGRSPAAAARSGHRLAGTVVGHRGAIIPRCAMPSLETPT